MGMWPFSQSSPVDARDPHLETSRVPATPSEPKEGQATLAALAALLEPFKGTERPVTARTDPGEYHCAHWGAAARAQRRRGCCAGLGRSGELACG